MMFLCPCEIKLITLQVNFIKNIERNNEILKLLLWTVWSIAEMAKKIYGKLQNSNQISYLCSDLCFINFTFSYVTRQFFESSYLGKGWGVLKGRGRSNIENIPLLTLWECRNNFFHQDFYPFCLIKTVLYKINQKFRIVFFRMLFCAKFAPSLCYIGRGGKLAPKFVLLTTKYKPSNKTLAFSAQKLAFILNLTLKKSIYVPSFGIYSRYSSFSVFLWTLNGTV